MSEISILTTKQKTELHKAILQYVEPLLKDSGNEETISKLNEILEIDHGSLNSIIPNYLEKKWSTVLRLQKRILDLENDLSNLKSSMEVHEVQEIVNAKGKINWIPASVKQTFKTQTNQQITTVSMHPFLPIIVSGCSDGTIIVWNLAVDDTTPEKIIKAHTRSVNRIVWSKKPLDLTDNGTLEYYFASCSSDLSVRVWNGSSYKQVRSLMGHEHTVSSLSFSSSNNKILYSVSRDKTIKAWDIVNANCIKTFVGHSDWVRNLDTVSSPNSSFGDFVISCSNDQSIRISHAESGNGVSLLIGHGHVVEDAKFLPLHSNKYIDKFIEKYNQRFQNIPSFLMEESIYEESLGYKYCISAGRDNSVKLWLLPPPSTQPHRPPMPSSYNNSQGWLVDNLLGHTSWVRSLVVHPNGRFIFSASDDKTIKVWDLDSLVTEGKAKCIRTLTGHEGFVNCIDFASFEEDNKTPLTGEELLKHIESKMRCLFISGGVDNSVKLWK
ncbi:nuclear distribution protein Pac1p [[Candida] jaroonii]|uniref:Nuclear distribution protein Pac1p n=1 Tax=[Candida] jaroonii TaxID=467808 RepID=A0ACA9YC40_9ASCO|nr:nuclear distribution protein Pac1p [[Candida] jaroonii]